MFPSISGFLRVFIINGYWLLSNDFSVSINLWCIFYIMLMWIPLIVQICIIGNKLIIGNISNIALLAGFTILFINSWIWCHNILFRIFISRSIKKIDLRGFCLFVCLSSSCQVLLLKLYKSYLKNVGKCSFFLHILEKLVWHALFLPLHILKNSLVMLFELEVSSTERLKISLPFIEFLDFVFLPLLLVSFIFLEICLLY